MANWQPNNRAHACLWLFETWHHDRRGEPFSEVGKWSTDFVIRSAAGESASMRHQKVQTHAELLDGAFTSLFGAKYETDVDRDAALAAMAAVLDDQGKTLADLGDPVDASYRFIGEVQ